jgi:hypothetical protein
MIAKITYIILSILAIIKGICIIKNCFFKVKSIKIFSRFIRRIFGNEEARMVFIFEGIILIIFGIYISYLTLQNESF